MKNSSFEKVWQTDSFFKMPPMQALYGFLVSWSNNFCSSFHCNGSIKQHLDVLYLLLKFLFTEMGDKSLVKEMTWSYILTYLIFLWNLILLKYPENLRWRLQFWCIPSLANKICPEFCRISPSKQKIRVVSTQSKNRESNMKQRNLKGSSIKMYLIFREIESGHLAINKNR